MGYLETSMPCGGIAGKVSYTLGFDDDLIATCTPHDLEGIVHLLQRKSVGDDMLRLDQPTLHQANGLLQLMYKG